MKTEGIVAQMDLKGAGADLRISGEKFAPGLLATPIGPFGPWISKSRKRPRMSSLFVKCAAKVARCIWTRKLGLCGSKVFCSRL